MDRFELTTEFKPEGDQPQAIKQLVDNFKNNISHQVLLGATGTGKTFTIANVIEKTQLNTLVIVHNKTLAAQLYAEFKELFKKNNVEYYVSYFDFYQPEAYIPRTDTYIEKSAVTNKEIEMLRLSTINSLSSNKPTIVVASIAAIYSTVAPNEFKKSKIVLSLNQTYNIKKLKYDLAKLQYANKLDLTPGTFRSKGDVLEIAPGYTDEFIIQVSFYDNDIEKITLINQQNKSLKQNLKNFTIIPANEYIMNKDNYQTSINRIREELEERIKYFEKNKKLLEAQRIKERTNHDIESLEEIGFCNGIENYSRHIELRKEGETPFTLFDYFSNDWLLVIDESHMTIPQARGMYETDHSRKNTLVEYGWRLKSALDNRPLNFSEFQNKISKAIFVSATPNEWEINFSNNHIVQQIVRPTGLIDPTIEIVDTKNNVEHLINEIKKRINKNERVFVTVLTIKMAESLTNHLNNQKIKVMYLHNEISTLERTQIINDLRRGKYDVIVGINLLREGLDVPEVSLVAIFDADAYGFFRSDKALIQTIGRASRNINGHIIMYAKTTSDAMKKAIDETNRRRNIQIEFNKTHNITPKTIKKPIMEVVDYKKETKIAKKLINDLNSNNHVKKTRSISILKKEMLKAANNHEYERAAAVRDIILDIEGKL